MLSGSAMASASDSSHFFSLAEVSISPITPSMMPPIDIQAPAGQNVLISMSVPLVAGCYEFFVQAFANTQGSVSATGNAAASCNVLLSP
jgi:hypothetical protein